jgi:PAS domain S-box-containing protein
MSALHALLASVIDQASSDGVLLVEGDGRVLHANAAARGVLAGRPHDHLARIVPAEALAHALHEAASGRTAELTIAVDAPVRALLGALAPRDDAGPPLYVLRITLPTADLWPGESGQAGDAPWLWDVEAGREIYSHEWKRMLGHADHEVGESAAEWRSRVHPDDLDAAVATIREGLAPERPGFRLDHRLRHRDGSWRWVRSWGRVVERAPDGRALRVVGIDRDVTDVRALQRAVDQREASLSMAERLSGIGCWSWRPDTDEVTWSPGLFRLFRVPESDGAPRFRDQAALFTPESYARLRAASATALAEGTPYRVELDIVRTDGSTGTVVGIGEAVPDAGGGVRMLWGVAREVSEERQQDAALRRSERMLQRMSRIGRIGAWTFDAERNALEWTEQTRAIHEWPEGHSVDPREAVDCYLPQWREQLVESMRAAVLEGRPFDLEAQIRTARGRIAWVRVMGEGETTADGRRRVAGVLQDIDAAKTARLQLARALDHLRARNRELREFASAASHDLQEPLRKIQTFASLLSERFGEQLHPQARDWLSRMDSAAARMAELVADVLTYSRISQQRVPASMCDLGAIVAEVLGDLEVAIARDLARVEVGPLPVVAGDPTQFRQLLQNLVGNALKYRHPDRAPHVRVSAARVELPLAGTESTAPHWRIEVADNGIGFEPRYAEHIFGAYKRLHDHGTYAGTGMGLAIVRRVAERHGGRAFARGVPGEGAVLSIELPVGGPPPEQHRMYDDEPA